ncbi:MAG: precorrin-6Y C5,15-methyltransferase (decarboxylating) subunit CbiT [Eubacterium sp.]|nr:precorrin-6Y C5,15-methyltransferase (decarboxylating) subunit CbiT [Eubacterium sp.]
MSKVLIFAGTTEGRELAKILVRSGISCHVSVATQYGSMVMKNLESKNSESKNSESGKMESDESELIQIHQGRLDQEEMRELYKSTECQVVVDATHPYAQVVTETILKSIEGSTIKYIRLLRENSKYTLGGNSEYNLDSSDMLISHDSNDLIRDYKSVSDCARELENTDGKVLITTGSKELRYFCEKEGLRKRLLVRVLPGMESLKLCYDCGLEGKQIIAMQGPFTSEMNKAIINQYDIKHLVTKESGNLGGFDTKLEAAYESRIMVHMIKRPDSSVYGMNMKECLEKLEEYLDIKIKKSSLNITLAGIGCGSYEGMTIEVKNAISESDYIFGAARMLEGISAPGVTFPYYMEKDIIPILDKLEEERIGNTNIVILFSGDSGFYSGAENMYKALKNRKDTYVKLLPGISSISLLAARTGISWQDAKILSLHGVSEEVWISQLMDAVACEEKTFFISSGLKDIKRLGKLLNDMADKNLINEADIDIKLGYRLSYMDEEVTSPSFSDMEKYEKEGLYVGLILNRNTDKRVDRNIDRNIDRANLAPSISDQEFIRGKVPMTKEEIRHLSICKLRLKSGDVVYDIGSGTGSIAIEVAGLSKDIKVYAFEYKNEATELIKENIKKHNKSNIKLIQKKAPDGLDQVDKGDAAFIGGSGGRLKEILNRLFQINPQMKIVINAVSMETIVEMDQILKDIPIKNLDICQVSISKIKELGAYHMMQANNPVFIYSFEFCQV